MRLLLVEDNAKLSALAAEGLQKAGFTVDCVASVEDALAAVDGVVFDAVILDLGLPDGDGKEVLFHLRNKRDRVTPLLILTARDSLDDRVDGLNSGADDYLVKPFAMPELIARIKALLRRPGGALGVTLTVGDLIFNTVDREVVIGDRPVTLSRRELDVLEQLMRRVGKVVSKTVMEERIYGYDDEVESNAVEAHISRLRKRLASATIRVVIHTVRGVGYMIMERNDS
ncbi:MAG: response regulator transcription factor [Magnetococcales bacterium]|nr:response regulator transcription factor [Magnetococcales bacterium]